MKNKDIYELYNALCQIENNQDLTFNLKISYAMAKNKNILEPQVKLLEDLRMKILKKYGTVQEDGSIKIPNDIAPQAVDELNELFEQREEVKIITLPISEFGDLKLNLANMSGLMHMIYIE